MRYVYSFKECPDEILDRIGGKGASLVRMVRMGLPVPEGYVVCADAFVDGRPRAEVMDELKACLSSSFTYAVRSSALNEDGADNSFAGQYETVTDVSVDDIYSALCTVAESAYASRVESYSSSVSSAFSGIGVVVQRFVKPSLAGVLFTADIISGSSAFMIGNYVKGEGEALVSGSANAYSFRISSMKYAYEGDAEMKRYAKSLFKYASLVRSVYGCEVDVEWAVSSDRLYMLQARPITTLKRIDWSDYSVNGSRAGEYLLTKTNVGEIFMKALTPMTYSALDKINQFLGLPGWLDAVEGQAYMNVSVMCSMLIAMGMKREKAYKAIKDLAGNIPEGVIVPVFPFDGKKFRKGLRKVFFGDKSGMRKMSRKEKIRMVEEIPTICRNMITDIRSLSANEELDNYWSSLVIPRLKEGLAAVMASCGMKMLPLFRTRQQLTDKLGAEMANRLCGGCLGVLDSMKPVLYLEDLIDGKIDVDEYMSVCGHRCINEMELGEPRPYEIEGYAEKQVAGYESLGINAHEMLRKSSEDYKAALSELSGRNAVRVKRKLDAFVEANRFREDIRSKGVWIFCVLREFLLRAGAVNNIGSDIFMLSLDEAFALIKGDDSALRFIPARKETYERYLSYPPLPGVILGRFDIDLWMNDPARRTDFYSLGMEADLASSSVSGFPGAAGKVRGRVHVIRDLSEIDSFCPGEVLVTCATNVGWTPVFPKAAAIVTDIGAPLSHAAIVAREFGIPAVVGCANATTVLKTGDMVEVNGSAGTVTLINP